MKHTQEQEKPNAMQHTQQTQQTQQTNDDFEMVITPPLLEITPATTHLATTTNLLETVDVKALVEVKNADLCGEARVLVMADISPSMAGQPLELLREAVLSLADKEFADGVDVKMAFGGFAAKAIIIDAEFESLKDASPRLQRVVDQFNVGSFFGGSTNHQSCMQVGIDHLAAAQRLAPARANHLLILTDGNPTSGETSPHRLRELADKLAQNAKLPPVLVSVLTIGRDVNHSVPAALHAPSRGVVAHAPTSASLEESLSACLNHVGRSALPFVVDICDSKSGVDATRRAYLGIVTDTAKTAVVTCTVSGHEVGEPVAAATVGMGDAERVPLMLTYVATEAEIPESAKKVPQALADELKAAEFADELQRRLAIKVQQEGVSAGEAFLEAEEGRLEDDSDAPSLGVVHRMLTTYRVLSAHSAPDPYSEPGASTDEFEEPAYRSLGSGPPAKARRVSGMSSNDAALFLGGVVNQSRFS